MLDKLRQLFKTTGEIPAEGTVPLAILQEYYKARNIQHKTHICHAPFNNMYFNTEGHVANCWLTFYKAEVYDGSRSIMDIWKGEKFTKLREQIKKGDLETSCKTCQTYLLNKNFTNVLAKAYDNDFPLSDFPSLMEFELSNDCNLECTMCNGLLSSSIRKNREGLPTLRSPYGDRFVQDLRAFIPHLREARFNGGEPFLIQVYYKIWDAILELNPSLRMVIATNGTVLNTRVKDYLSRGNFHINLSMDGFSKETYETVRLNADHRKMMENFKFFHQYCAENNRTLCIMINPMRQNWQEMPDFVNFCNDHNIHLWFNTIMRPEDQAIWNLPAEELQKIYDTLSAAIIKPRTTATQQIYNYNVSTYHNLVQHQIKDWLKDAQDRGKQTRTVYVRGYEEPGDVFWERMQEYLNKKSSNETVKTEKELKSKIETMASILGNEWDDALAYDTMLRADIAVVYDALANESPEKLSDMLRASLKRDRA
jgi:radical SAM protein with 4Fe4S-binding SPASM domain